MPAPQAPTQPQNSLDFPLPVARSSGKVPVKEWLGTYNDSKYSAGSRMLLWRMLLWRMLPWRMLPCRLRRLLRGVLGGWAVKR